MVTLRAASKRLGRGSSSAAKSTIATRSKTSRPIPAVSSSDLSVPVESAEILPNPVPNLVGNTSIPSVPGLIPQNKTSSFEGVQHFPYFLNNSDNSGLSLISGYFFTIDKCYKIHGYPVGFKHKNKNGKPVVAQVALAETQVNNNTTGEQPFQGQTLSQDQIQSVIAYFNSQLSPSADSPAIASTPGGTITALPGVAFSSSTIGFVGILRTTGNTLSSKSLIIDSGATHHVSHDKSLFVSISDISDKTIT